ncbi:MAG: hypothetical protein HBSAPP03_08910 [Phycisphaerae bacterium]|nr:MAG: hypothetical protein HBSAPP03_08910 [Phycisphaerae bacterium]
MKHDMLGCAASVVVSISTMAQPVPEQAQAPAAPVAQAPALFTRLEGAQPFVPRPWMTPTGVMRLDEGVLLRAREGHEFTIEPEPGRVLTCRIERVTGSHERRRIIAGSLAEAEDGHFAVSYFDDAIALSLRAPSLGVAYGLRFMGNGIYTIYRFNDADLPPCEGSPTPPPEPPLERAEDDDDYLPPAPPGYDDRYGGGCGGGTPMLDMMVVYTPAARDEAGGTSAIRAVAALAIDQTSTSYINSDCPARARLVSCTEVSYTEVNNDTDLDRLTNTSDGWIDGVHTTRDNVNADMVMLYTTVGSGLAWCGGGANSAFGTLDWTRATSDFTHAHESGHNTGCGHDSGNIDCDPTPPYGRGWRFNGTNGTQYRTVMAYPPGSVIMYYSNPAVSFQGTATGVANAADNHLAINNRDNSMENYELTRWDIYVEIGAAPIVEIGTYAFPYNTLAEGIAAIQIPGTGTVESPNLYLRNSTTVNPTITKAMTIIPCGGAVTIGSP